MTQSTTTARAAALAASWHDVFEPTPRLTSESDLLVWFVMRARLGGGPLPQGQAAVRAALRGAFHAVVGLDLGTGLIPTQVSVASPRCGDVGAGTVDVTRWREQLLPLLLRRAADAQPSSSEHERDLPSAPTWYGQLEATAVAGPVHELADAAKVGDWTRVMAMLEADTALTPNRWRPSGKSWYSAMHQAAWHGAGTDVVQALLDRGGWRNLRNGRGQRPWDVALARGHRHLLEVLDPAVPEALTPARVEAIDRHLAALVATRVPAQALPLLRHPSCEVLNELSGRALRYPVAAMRGGFRLELRTDHLYVRSWSATVPGEAHVVSEHGHLVVGGTLS